MDYRALDLTAYTNAIDDTEVPGYPCWRGEAQLHGLPFFFAEDGDGVRLLRLEPGTSLTIPMATGSDPVRTVTFAHRSRGAEGPGFVPPGREDGLFNFTLSDGGVVRVPIREGFEIAPPWFGEPVHWGALPSLGLPDQKDSLPERDTGAWAETGRRQTEIVRAGRWSDAPGSGGPSISLRTGRRGVWRYYLWSWVNPSPELDVVQIQLEARDGVVEIGAVCLGYIDEHPLLPEPAQVVVAGVPKDAGSTGTDLTVTVDRGTAGFTTALYRQPDARDPMSTWGEEPDAEAVGVYARVSSLGSGTVRLVASDATLSEVRWADLRKQSTTGLRVTELGRNWVRTTIVDDTTGEPLPCRVNFSSPEGVPYQPHGHHHHANSNLPSWHMDVGADVMLGRTTYAYVDGMCEGWLPRGPVRIRAARGFEYGPLDDVVTVDDDTRELTVRLKRLFDPTTHGWYSGDTHVHFVSSFGALKEAEAEGISVVHLLQSQWGSLFTNIQDFAGKPVESEDGKTVVFTSQENRQHFLGHLSLLGLKEPVMPWCTDGPDEAEMGAGLEATLSDWADRCRAQGGTVVLPHFPLPSGEQSTLIATERVDAVETLATTYELGFLHYYRYLNAGYRLPLVGGTDKMSADVPLGLARTYARLGPDDDFGFDAWCAAMRRGRCYMTSGPILDLAVGGAGIGDTVRLPENGGTVSVHATARSILPMFRLELVHAGRVIASSTSESGVHELRIEENLRIDGPGWICARVGGGGPDHLTHHRDKDRRAILAHTSPVYISCGERERPADRDSLRFIQTLIDRAHSYVTLRGAASSGMDVLHQHGGNHREFLIRPFEEARAAVERRLRLAEP